MISTKMIIAIVVLLAVGGPGVYLAVTPRIPGNVSLAVGESVSSLDRSAQLRLDSIITDGDDKLVVTGTDKGVASTLTFTPTHDLESFGEYQVRLCNVSAPVSAEFAVSKGSDLPTCKAAK